MIDAPMFERERRHARLSEEGEEMLLGRATRRWSSSASPKAIARRVRIGVTELTAMTWLPSLVQLVRRQW